MVNDDSLLFITHVNTPPNNDGSTQTLIRRHVMRDIGFSRRRIRRARTGNSELRSTGMRSSGETATVAEAVTTNTSVNVEVPGTAASSKSNATLAYMRTKPAHICDESDMRTMAELQDMIALAFKPPPIFYLEMWMERFVKAVHYYGTSLNVGVDIIKNVWLQMADLDHTALLCTFVQFQAWLGRFHPPTASLPNFYSRLLYSYNKAIQEIRAKIANPILRYSDAVIAGTVALTCATYMWEDTKSSLVHLQGLRSLVHARGGFSTLGKNLALQYAACFAENIAATIDDSSPVFSLPSTPTLRAFCGGVEVPYFGRQISVSWKRRIPSHSSLIDVFDDLALYIARLRQDPTGAIFTTLDPGIVYIAYFLQHLNTTYNIVNSNTHEIMIARCIKTAIHINLWEPRRKFGIYPGPQQKQRVAQLQRLIQMINWEDLELLKIWTLTVGIRESHATAQSWFLQERVLATQQFPRSIALPILQEIQSMVLN